MRTLVVYYSRTGNTRFVAERVAAKRGADLEELKDRKDRSGPVGWLVAGKDATLGKETKIGAARHSPGKYDLIILGVPVWNSRVPPAMRTYLNRNDLSGKKVAFFCTNQGTGSRKTFDQLKGLAHCQNPVSELVVSNALKNKEASEEKVKAWCLELK